MSLLTTKLDGDLLMDSNCDVRVVIPGIIPAKKNRMIIAHRRLIKDKSVREAEALVKTCAAVAMSQAGLPIITGPVALEVVAYYPDRKRRDIHNITGSLFDAMQGVVFEDDHQVVDTILSKRLCERGQEHTEVKVWALEEDERFPLKRAKK